MIVLLDSGPLGILSSPSASPRNLECRYWSEGLIAKGYKLIVPEIADFEVRRELLRANKNEGLRRLDALKAKFQYLPLIPNLVIIVYQ